DEVYLKPYKRARTALPAKLAALRGLVSDSPAQLKRLDAIEELAGRRLAKLGAIVALRRRSEDAALAEFRAGGGRRLMEGLGEQFAAFKAHEREQLQSRVEESGRAGLTSH